MGLFDKLLGGQTSKNIELTEREAVAAILLVVVAADGHVSDDEARQFNSVVNRMQLFQAQSGTDFSAMIDKLVGLIKKHGANFLVERASCVIAVGLRDTVFALATDLIFADGSVEDEEKALLEHIQKELEVSDELAVKIIEVLQIKNRG